MKSTNYETYRKLRTREEYFSNWENPQQIPQSEEEKEKIYQDNYVFYFTVFNRDNFTCQNKIKKIVDEEAIFEPCPYCNNEPYFISLTLHHIRHKRNFKDKDGNWIGNPNKPRNGVIVCQGSHNAFNRNKIGLSFDKDNTNVPNHIRGHTLWLHKEERIDWKKQRAKNVVIRKNEKLKLEREGILKFIRELPIGKRVWYSLPLAQIAILFLWLTVPYYEM